MIAEAWQGAVSSSQTSIQETLQPYSGQSAFARAGATFVDAVRVDDCRRLRQAIEGTEGGGCAMISVALVKASPRSMHRTRFDARILVMGIDLKICLPTSEATSNNGLGCARERSRRILAMAESMTDMFGDAALSVAQSQISGSDVAGRSGVRWQDIVDGLRGSAP